MGDPQRQLSGTKHGRQLAAHGLVGQYKVDLRLHGSGPAHGVLLQGLPEQAVTVRGIVEVVDGLVQGFSRKIRKLLLEGAEGNGALVEVLGALRGLEAQAVLHKVVHPPVAVFAHMYPALAFVRGD